jgi:hypothetical protein
MPETRFRRHMCIDLQGALNNWSDRRWKGVCTDPETGRALEPFQVRAIFLDELNKGHRVYPMTSECEGFDYETGCPGHPMTEWEIGRSEGRLPMEKLLTYFGAPL